jgi:hypothetical protein
VPDHIIKLGLNSYQMKEIIELPNRENVKLSLKQYPSDENLIDLFENVIERIVKQRNEFEQMLIFYRLVADCGSLYAMFINSIHSSIMCHIQMYHSKTLTDLKTKIKKDMTKENG